MTRHQKGKQRRYMKHKGMWRALQGSYMLLLVEVLRGLSGRLDMVEGLEALLDIVSASSAAFFS